MAQRLPVIRLCADATGLKPASLGQKKSAQLAFFGQCWGVSGLSRTPARWPSGNPLKWTSLGGGGDDVLISCCVVKHEGQA